MRYRKRTRKVCGSDGRVRVLELPTHPTHPTAGTPSTISLREVVELGFGCDLTLDTLDTLTSTDSLVICSLGDTLS